ncbi:MAG TPA: DUF3014 domain-containing protein [Desulfuromonadales bacterium]|nr:DUF3014 domain-containing protein [Desulfuromonadales bacterium]
MRNWPFWVGCLAAAVIIIVYLLFFRGGPPEPVLDPVPAPDQPISPPAIEHPIEQAAEGSADAEPVLDPERPLPQLQQSDDQMKEILGRLFAEQNLGRFFLLEHIIERFVVMVDNLPRQSLPVTHRPLKKIPGSFEVEGPSDAMVIAPANYRRYAPVIGLLEKADVRQVVAVYVKLYPLFQQTYEKLGYPEGYFNDRLVEVIDHLLATPVVHDPVRVIRPKTLYLFADPALEAFSAGRKILIRTGPDNAERIKNLLRTYRQALTKTGPGNG